ncbi:hypothetical protein [Dactylosporangium cerinum]
MAVEMPPVKEIASGHGMLALAQIPDAVGDLGCLAGSGRVAAEAEGALMLR